MSDAQDLGAKMPKTDQPDRRSASAEAAAVRRGAEHPESDVAHPTPSVVPEAEGVVPNRHSASAEAAALRWREQHDDTDR